jgi:hypothetical protein
LMGPVDLRKVQQYGTPRRSIEGPCKCLAFFANFTRLSRLLK